MLAPMISPLQESKDALRQDASQRRASVQNRETAAQVLAEVGLATLRGFLQDGRNNITGYWPVRSEIDSRPLLHALHDTGFTLALPSLIKADTPEMEFRFWTPETPLIEGCFGIPTPPPESGVMETPDILLVPLLAFDRDGFRLGYGGGYYDRALQRFRHSAHRVLAFGVAFALQERETLPREPHDQPLDGVLTPEGLLYSREGNA